MSAPIVTYTNVFNTKRTLYGIQDMALPFPIPLDAVGIFVLSAAPWFAMLNYIFNYGIISHALISFVIWVGPPGLLAYLSAQKTFENRAFIDYMKAQIIYIITRGVWADLNKKNNYIEDGYRIDVSYWEKVKEV